MTYIMGDIIIDLQENCVNLRSIVSARCTKQEIHFVDLTDFTIAYGHVLWSCSKVMFYSHVL